MNDGELVFDCEWFGVERLALKHVRGLGGKPFYRINSPDGVIVLAVTSTNEIVLVNQFRPAVGEFTLELPAGVIDGSEKPVEAAARELFEETSYVCERLVSLGHVRIMANRLNARQHVFVGLDASVDRPSISTEDTRVVLASPLELKRLVLDGKFNQSAGIAMLLLADWHIGTTFASPSLEPKREN